MEEICKLLSASKFMNKMTAVLPVSVPVTLTRALARYLLFEISVECIDFNLRGNRKIHVRRLFKSLLGRCGAQNIAAPVMSIL